MMLEAVHELRGSWLAPGFVDLHIHGGGSAAAQSGDLEAIYQVAMARARRGTPTIVAGDSGSIRCATTDPVPGSTSIGSHPEGLYLSHRQ
ncbi:hypothetical protein [Kribbella kalugense]|uniref:hypothetical protein n=1 Tax=Kribbella kalugense TaxID=2512221 RepID=UPI001065C66C|nr:hypothetical protein [Kribbella kalugense]